MAHVGVYTGDGRVIHARGHAYGVVENMLDEVRFTHYLIPTGLYDGGLPTLRRGNTGEYVTMLQQALKEHGAQLEVDGKYGSATEKAVKAFQQANGLKADGICGPKTWDAIGTVKIPDDHEPPEQELPDQDDDAADLVVLPRKGLEEVRDTVNQVLNRLNTMMNDEGMLL